MRRVFFLGAAGGWGMAAMIPCKSVQTGSALPRGRHAPRRQSRASPSPAPARRRPPSLPIDRPTVPMLDKRFFPRQVVESSGNRWDWALLPLVLALLVALAYGGSQMARPYQLGETLPLTLDPAYLPYYLLRTTLRMFAGARRVAGLHLRVRRDRGQESAPPSA